MPETLPHPHARNDCGACRKRSADVRLPGAEYEHPGKQPVVLCKPCPGSHPALRAVHLSRDGLDGPATFTMTLAPGRPGHLPAGPAGPGGILCPPCRERIEAATRGGPAGQRSRSASRGRGHIRRGILAKAATSSSTSQAHRAGGAGRPGGGEQRQQASGLGVLG
jgi:hypothetical protein